MSVFHEIPPWLLAGGLLVLMVAANEIGFRIAQYRHSSESEHSRSVAIALKGSVFGLVAFLLGFAFSMSSSRYDARQRIVLEEANAIGTCHLRAGLLPESPRNRIRAALKRYLDARIDVYEKGSDPAERSRAFQEMNAAMTELWKGVEEATQLNPPLTQVSQIIPAANAVIDSNSTAVWSVRNHVPDPVFLLLMICAVVSSLLAGHSSGQAKRRHIWLWAALNTLLVLVLFMVMDLDLPRRGLIHVDHTPLIEARTSLQTPPP